MVIFATVVGSSIFATLSTSPATWIKVLIGCMSIASAILAAINQWAPFTGSSEQQRKAEAECGAIRVDLEDDLKRLREKNITIKKALDEQKALDRRYKAVTEDRKGPSVGDRLYRQARTSAKDEVEKDFGIKVDLIPVDMALVR